jgi:hypothetical protein
MDGGAAYVEYIRNLDTRSLLEKKIAELTEESARKAEKKQNL